jgi:FdhD protein
MPSIRIYLVQCSSRTEPMRSFRNHTRVGALEVIRNADDAMQQPLEDQGGAAVVYLALCETKHKRSAQVCVAEETPVAFQYAGISHGVMMASPEDLEDFATGFSVSEGIIDASGSLQAISISRQDDGITIDISLEASDLHRYLAGRRVRQMRGHTSCGLCGVTDLADIRRAPSQVRAGKSFDIALIRPTLDLLRQWQPLSRQTRGAHASAWVMLDGQLSAVREDVGRHNSLDKLIGCLVRGRYDRHQGFCLITSRCSFEMVQKAVAAGFPTLVSVGAPTAQAVRLSAAAGLRLYTLSRDGEPLLFTSPRETEMEVWPERAG